MGLALAACGSTSDLTLALTDTDHDCTDVFASVESVSIEIIATNGKCKLNHVCVDRVADLTTLDDLIAALQATPVLLEFPGDDAQEVVINGRPKQNCFVLEDDANHPVMCGFGNLAVAADGVLDVELDADGAAGVCAESTELCP